MRESTGELKATGICLQSKESVPRLGCVIYWDKSVRLTPLFG